MNDGIRARVLIRLLPAEEGGRSTPAQGSYRPNHNFGAPSDRTMDVAFIEFESGETLNPGDAVEREITFWQRPGLDDVIVPGRRWHIQEGDRLVGTGVVLKVLDPNA